MKRLLYLFSIISYAFLLQAQTGLVSGELNVAILPTNNGNGTFSLSGNFTDPKGQYFASDVDAGMCLWKGNNYYLIDSASANGSTLTLNVEDTYNTGFLPTGIYSVGEQTPRLGLPGVSTSGDSNSALASPPDYAAKFNYILQRIDQQAGNGMFSDVNQDSSWQVNRYYILRRVDGVLGEKGEFVLQDSSASNVGPVFQVIAGTGSNPALVQLGDGVEMPFFKVEGQGQSGSITAGFGSAAYNLPTANPADGGASAGQYIPVVDENGQLVGTGWLEASQLGALAAQTFEVESLADTSALSPTNGDFLLYAPDTCRVFKYRREQEEWSFYEEIFPDSYVDYSNAGATTLYRRTGGWISNFGAEAASPTNGLQAIVINGTDTIPLELTYTYACPTDTLQATLDSIVSKVSLILDTIAVVESYSWTTGITTDCGAAENRGFASLTVFFTQSGWTFQPLYTRWDGLQINGTSWTQAEFIKCENTTFSFPGPILANSVSFTPSYWTGSYNDSTGVGQLSTDPLSAFILNNQDYPNINAASIIVDYCDLTVAYQISPTCDLVNVKRAQDGNVYKANGTIKESRTVTINSGAGLTITQSAADFSTSGVIGLFNDGHFSVETYGEDGNASFEIQMINDNEFAERGYTLDITDFGAGDSHQYVERADAAGKVWSVWDFNTNDRTDLAMSQDGLAIGTLVDEKPDNFAEFLNPAWTDKMIEFDGDAQTIQVHEKYFFPDQTPTDNSLLIYQSDGSAVFGQLADTLTITIPCFAPSETVTTGTVGFWNCPDHLIGGQVVESQVAFYNPGSGGDVNVQLTDGLLGFFGTTIADGDRVETSNNGGAPLVLTSEQFVAVLVSSIGATTPPDGLVVNLKIIAP